MKYNWKKYTLNDVCSRIYSGGTPSTRNPEYWNGNFNWLSSGETSQRFIYNTERTITQKGIDNSSTKLAKKGCTVVATAGQGYTRGQVSFLMIDTYMNQSVIACESNPKYILPLYLYYNLDNRYEEFRLLSDGTSTRGGLSGWILKRMEIDLPPLDIQKKIVSILKPIDDKIELNRAVNENLQTEAQAIFKHWFIDFEFPNEEGQPYKSSGGKMIWNEELQKEIPEGWKSIKLGDTTEIKRGASPRPIQNFLSSKGLNWLKISDVTNLQSPFILDIKEHIIDTGLKNTVYLNKGALILSNSATPGIPKILDVDSCIHDGWLYFPKSCFSNEFLYLLFLNIKNDLIRLGNGTVFNNLKTDIVKNFFVLLPKENILKLFNTSIISIFKMIRHLTRENKQLADLRDTLLPRLMSGELDVSNVKLKFQSNSHLSYG